MNASESPTPSGPLASTYRWIEEATPFLRDLWKSMPESSAKSALDSLLMGVPCEPQDLGFDSPADKFARRYHTLSQSEKGATFPDKLTDAERLHWIVIVNLGVDEIGGIDLHERAMSHCVERLRGEIDDKTEPNEQDYIAAIRDGIHEAIYGD